MEHARRGRVILRTAAGLAGAISAVVIPLSAFGQEAAGGYDLAAALALKPADALLLAIAAGGVIAGFVGVLLYVSGRTAQKRAQTALTAQAEEARRGLDDARALLASEPHLLFLWRGAADAAPVMSGALPADFDLPGDLDGRLDFAAWLDPGDASQLNSALIELKVAGTPFNIFVQTPGGQRITADGFAVAGKAALKFKPLHGDSLDFLENRERSQRLELELGSLRAGLGASPQPAWLRGPDGALAWVNAAYAAVVGAKSPAAAVAGKLELSSAKAASQAVAAVRDGEVSRQRLHTGNGAGRRTFEVIEVPAPQGSAGIATEMTRIDALRDELDRHISAHGRTLDRLNTAVAIFDPDQRLKFFNSAYAALWGLDGTWLRQEPSDGEILDQLRDQGRLEERADYRKWRQDRLDAYACTDAVEDEWHLPDGRSLRVVAEPQPNGGLTYLFEDVTERLALEARYNGLLSVQKETLDNLHEGVALFGSDGRLKLFNPAFATIWKLDSEALGKEPHMDALIAACTPLTGPTEHWDELRRSITAEGEGRRPVAGRMHRADGVVVDYASVPLPDGATLFTYVDMTDGWRIEQALRERTEALLAADQLKTAFLSHVSYELRAPLTPIMGYAEFLAMGTVGPLNDKQGEYVGVIQEASADLRDLIDNIIDLTTIDAGAMALDMRPVDIEALAHDAVAGAIESQGKAAGLAIVFDIEPDIKGFIGDADRLKQVLRHLLSNAVGFSSDGGKVTIGARASDTEVALYVADEGRGIDPAVLSRIFDRFETHTEDTRHRGPGLGLTIVKGLVELHQGRVEIDTEPGKGTTVTCRFPLAPANRPSGDNPDARATGLNVSPALDQNAPPTAPRH
ncbi:FIG056333: sensor [hydrothermal vent metagenome]|uniref:histidine kinase n=1 Tax=hydrothermal vent metagenome TaxID=652676 RepID=A0A3B0THM0_9ZZZZ